ncbi:hypothetical protein [Bradyrhizobium sp. BR 10261]|uniref:hypothetical protein n=1 Tax=Bradyrhizobium sp. BR 10261 TaxID=2749992 RepID=UPI001C65217C|nr:hypothetical protein [Bradyrhizobium sp. BR 10261]MBW7965303.1 hypothetical protein [Bradyrhizobium sp. BR 10261]
MRKTLFLFLLLLTGCMSAEERTARNEAQDDQACLSYGAKKGTESYVNCRAQLEGSRRQADAAIDAGMIASRAGEDRRR